MGKLPRFIVGDNILVDRNRIFITHNREPRFVAEVFHLDVSEEEARAELLQQCELYSTLEYKDQYIVIAVAEIFPTKPQTKEQLAKMMSRTGDWYFQYLRVEDSE